jgi:HAD superfamily hydrolase (TIGR01509 family)
MSSIAHQVMLDALLFDLDGTLVDTDAIHMRAWQQVLEPYEIRVTPELYRAQIMGFSDEAIAATVLQPVPRGKVRELFAQKALGVQYGINDTLQPREGIAELLKWALALGLVCGVVTNADRAHAERLLECVGLRPQMRLIVCGPELLASKPNPLPYTEALRQAGVSADAAHAFEDSLAGVASAVGAGIPTTAIDVGLDRDTVMSHGVGYIAEHFADWALLQRLQRQARCC